MAASTGGHLAQLVRLAPMLGVHPDSPWVTFDTPQSRSLLAGKDVLYVPYIAPRDLRGAFKAARIVNPLVRDTEGAVSTGAALAVGVLPQSRAMGKPAVYIESISRVNGPSLSGQILQRMPRIGLFAQHRSWAKPPWLPGPSVLSTYSRKDKAITERGRPLRVLVTLGTIAPYRFDRLVDLVKTGLSDWPGGAEVVWQLGCTTRDDLPGTAVANLSAADFQKRMRWADVVVAHAGVGTAMEILDAGHVPVLASRLSAQGEHVDDHQLQIFNYLVERGLAFDASKVMAGTNDELLSVLATGATQSPSTLTHVKLAP